MCGKCRDFALVLLRNEEERWRAGGSCVRKVLVCEYEHNFQNVDSSCVYARRSVNSLEGEFGRCVKFA